MPEKPSIFFIEDHPVVCDGLVTYFNGTGRWHVSGSAFNLIDAKTLLTHASADVLLLDIQLENSWGLDIIPWLKTKPILAVYSAFDDFIHVNAALGMGVQVYICKRRSAIELEQALLKALDGETCIDDTIQIKLDTVANVINLLTRREAEILTMVKNGLSNKDIAANLGISYRTVENILSCVYDKTGIKSRLELQKL